MQDLSSLLDYLRVQVSALSSTSSVDDEPRRFLMGLARLGLLLEADPSQRAVVHSFASETAPKLAESFMALEAFGADLSRRSEIDWSDDPSLFERLCAQRSALAFLAELYQGTALDAELAGFDQTWLDEIMRDHGHHGHLEPDAIPPHMPTRHWWWWLPDTPPA
jgi:hypothetical protein